MSLLSCQFFLQLFTFILIQTCRPLRCLCRLRGFCWPRRLPIVPIFPEIVNKIHLFCLRLIAIFHFFLCIFGSVSMTNIPKQIAFCKSSNTLQSRNKTKKTKIKKNKCIDNKIAMAVRKKICFVQEFQLKSILNAGQPIK